MAATSLADLVKERPWLLGALIGGGIGAPVGMLRSDEGEEARGAAAGALGGAGLGALGGLGADTLGKLLSSQKSQMVLGGLAGVGGGMLGASRLAPWVKKRLMRQAETEPPMERPKEAAMGNETEKAAKEAAKDMANEARAELEKAAAMEKDALAHVRAFDFGIDLFCQENGINKQAFAEMLGFAHENEMAPGILECAIAAQSQSQA